LGPAGWFHKAWNFEAILLIKEKRKGEYGQFLKCPFEYNCATHKQNSSRTGKTTARISNDRIDEALGNGGSN
jgi:hypothetical protein